MATVSEADGGIGASCKDYGVAPDGEYVYLQFPAPKIISKIIWQKKPGDDAA